MLPWPHPTHPLPESSRGRAASDPCLPTMESGLGGDGEAAPWVWEEVLVHAESGLAPECRAGKCSDTHTIGKNGCLYYAIWHPSPGPAPRQSQPSCPEQRPQVASAESHCLTEKTMLLMPSCVRQTRQRVLSSSHWAGRLGLLTSSRGCIGPLGLLRTSGHSRKQCPRPLSCLTEQNRELARPLPAEAQAGVR